MPRCDLSPRSTRQLAGRLVPFVKRWCLLTHLYLGVAFSVLFVVWFASGVVMMYQGYPSLTRREALERSRPIDCSTCWVSPAAALALASSGATLSDLRLGMLGARPVWRVRDASGRWQAIHGDVAHAVPLLDTTAASAIASSFIAPRRRLHAATPAMRFVETLSDADQWTLTRTVRNQMPLMRFDVDDSEGTRLYISPHGAEVVSASTRRERLLTWIGAIPHWIYPTILRRHAGAWANVVIVVSALGTVMSVAGLAIGIWQWRWRRRQHRDGRPKPRSPYRDFMMRWHHMVGLGFGVFVCTWVFSGLLSMNPGRWSPGSSPTAFEARAWAGPAVDPARIIVAPEDAWRQFTAAGHAPHEVRLTEVAGRVYWLAVDVAGATALVRGDSAGSVQRAVPDSVLVAQAARVMPAARVTDAQRLNEYDQYYRDREHLLPLPVLRLKFDDPARTWMYIDPSTGTLTQKREWKSRLERWLYDGLHSFDFAWLANQRPLWDIVMITLSLGGLLCSVTGVVIGWRWIQSVRLRDAQLRRR